MRKSRTSHSGDRQRSDGRSRSDSNCFAHSNNAFFQKFRENYKKQVSGDKSNQLYQSAFPLKHIPERLNFSYRLLGRNIFNKSSLSGNPNFSDDNSPSAPNGKSGSFRNGNNMGRSGHFGGHYGPAGNRGGFGNGFNRNRRMEKRFKNYMRFQAQQGNLRAAEGNGPRCGQGLNNDQALAPGCNAAATDGPSTYPFIYESPSYSGSFSRNRDRSKTASPDNSNNNNGNKHNRYGGLKRKKPVGEGGFCGLNSQGSWPGCGRSGQRHFDKRRRMDSRSLGRFPAPDGSGCSPCGNGRGPRSAFGPAEQPAPADRKGNGRCPGNGGDRRPLEQGQQDAPLHSHAKRRALSCEREYNECVDRASVSSDARSSSSFYSSRSNSLSGESSKSNKSEITADVSRRSDDGWCSASRLSYSSDRSSAARSYSSRSGSSFSPGSDVSMSGRNAESARREDRKPRRVKQRGLKRNASVTRPRGKAPRTADRKMTGDESRGRRDGNVPLRASHSCRIGGERGTSGSGLAMRKCQSDKTRREFRECSPEVRHRRAPRQPNFDSRSHSTDTASSVSEGTFNVREPQQPPLRAQHQQWAPRPKRHRTRGLKASSSQTKSSSRSSKASQRCGCPSALIQSGSASGNGPSRQGSNRTAECSPVSETANRDASNLRSQPTLRLSDAYDSDDTDELQMDLSKPLHPIGYYVKDRQEMLEQMFHCVHGKRLTTMLPDILKNRDFEEIKARCLDQLECMSRKRLLCILDGREMVSSSGTEESQDESTASNNVSSQHYSFNSNGLKINKLRPLRVSVPAGVEDFTERLSGRRQPSGGAGKARKPRQGEGAGSQRWRTVKGSSEQTAEIGPAPQAQPRFEGTCVYPDDDFESYYNAFKTAPRGTQARASSQCPMSRRNSTSTPHSAGARCVYACSECGDSYSSSGLPSPSSYDSECSACESRNRPQRSELCKRRFKRGSGNAERPDPRQQRSTAGARSDDDSDEEYWAGARRGIFDLSAGAEKAGSVGRLLATDDEEECVLARAELDFLDDSSKNRYSQEANDLALDNLTLTVSDLSINERSPASESAEAAMTDACDSTSTTDTSSATSDDQSSDGGAFIAEREMAEANRICDEFWSDFEKAAAVRSPSDSAIASDMSALLSSDNRACNLSQAMQSNVKNEIRMRLDTRCLPSRYLLSGQSRFVEGIPIEFEQNEGCDYGACDHPSNPSQLVSYKEFLRNKIQAWLAKMETSKATDAGDQRVEEGETSICNAEEAGSSSIAVTKTDSGVGCKSSLAANQEDALEKSPISDLNDIAVQCICASIRDKLEIK